MDWNILWWLLAGLLIIAGLVGTVVPALPGAPLVFAGLFFGEGRADGDATMRDVLGGKGGRLQVVGNNLGHRLGQKAPDSSETP